MNKISSFKLSCTPDGTITSFNEELCSLLDKSKSELQDNNLLNFISSDTKNNLIEILNTNYSSDINNKASIKFVTTGDEEIMFQVTANKKELADSNFFDEMDISIVLFDDEYDDTINVTNKIKDVPLFNLKLKNDAEFILEKTNRNAEIFNSSLKPTSEKDELLQLKEEVKKLKAELNGKDKFFSIIAHDLKSPFTSILGFSEYIAKYASNLSSDEIKEYSTHLYNSSRNVFELIENLLHWSRIQNGRIEFSPVTTDLAQVVQEVLGLMQDVAHNKEISINNHIDYSTSVYVDQQMLKTILRNLISNAIKFTQSGGKISLICEDSEDYVSLSVKDSGVGMDSKKIDTLFELKSITSTSGTNKESGTGLGLVLCKEFIERNHGEITVVSELNKGSIFKFTIPKYSKFEPNLFNESTADFTGKNNS